MNNQKTRFTIKPISENIYSLIFNQNHVKTKVYLELSDIKELKDQLQKLINFSDEDNKL